MPFYSITRISKKVTDENDKNNNNIDVQADDTNINDQNLKNNSKNSNKTTDNADIADNAAPDRLIYDEKEGWVNKPIMSTKKSLNSNSREKELKNKDTGSIKTGILKNNASQSDLKPKEGVLPFLNMNSNAKVKMTKVFHFTDIDPSQNLEFKEPPKEEVIDLPDLPSCQCEGCKQKKYKILNPYLLNKPPEKKQLVKKPTDNKIPGKAEKNIQTDDKALVPYGHRTPECICPMCQERRRWDYYNGDRCSLCDSSECSLCDDDYCEYCESHSKYHNRHQVIIIKKPKIKSVVKEEKKGEKKEEKKEENIVKKEDKKEIKKVDVPTHKGFIVSDPNTRIARKTVLTKLKKDDKTNIPSVVISFQ